MVEGFLCCGTPLGVQGEQAAEQVKASFRERTAIKIETPDGKLAVERWCSCRELELQPTQQMIDQHT